MLHDNFHAGALPAALQTPGFSIQIVPETGSTNNDAKKAAASGVPEYTVIAAERQTGGKGRLGRSFFSPGGTGLYFSVILRPRMPASDALYITTAAAAAVSEAIEEVFGKQTRIKWVNDLFWENKKICGILTEASIAPNGDLNYAVLGIGVNVVSPMGGFPAELEQIAGALCTPDEYRPGMRAQLLAAILDRFHKYYAAFPAKDFLQTYRDRSILIGRPVTVHRGDESFEAAVTGIDDDCRLILERNGETVFLQSGEVSVRF